MHDRTSKRVKLSIVVNPNATSNEYYFIVLKSPDPRIKEYHPSYYPDPRIKEYHPSYYPLIEYVIVFFKYFSMRNGYGPPHREAIKILKMQFPSLSRVDSANGIWTVNDEDLAMLLLHI